MKKVLTPLALSVVALSLICGCASREERDAFAFRAKIRADIDRAIKEYREPVSEIPTEYSSKETKSYFHSLPAFGQAIRLNSFSCDTVDLTGAAVRIEVQRGSGLRMVRTDAKGAAMYDFRDGAVTRTMPGGKQEPCANCKESALVNLLYACIIDPGLLPKKAELAVQQVCDPGSLETTEEVQEVIADGVVCHRLSLTLRDNFLPFRQIVLFPDSIAGKVSLIYVSMADGSGFYVRISWTERDGFEFPAALKIGEKTIAIQNPVFSLVPMLEDKDTNAKVGKTASKNVKAKKSSDIEDEEEAEEDAEESPKAKKEAKAKAEPAKAKPKAKAKAKSDDDEDEEDEEE